VITTALLGLALLAAAAWFTLPLGAQPGADLGAAETAIRNGNPKAARVAAQAVLAAHPEHAEALFWLGRAAFDEGKYGEATGLFERATKADPTKSRYFEWYGNALGNEAQSASKLRQPFLAKRMKPAWEKAIELDPANLDARESLIQFYTQAPGFMGGSKEKAYAMAEEIRQRDERRGIEELGKLYERDKRWADAEKVYRAGASLQSERPLMRFRLANLFVLSAQHEKAFEEYESLVRSHPGERSVLYAIGRTAALSGLRLDRGAEALQEYLAQPASRTEPTHANAYFRLGNIREKQGRAADARAAYQRVLELDPKHKDAAGALKKLG
jgi:tetratricopeptide (TPR) repeat protein